MDHRSEACLNALCVPVSYTHLDVYKRQYAHHMYAADVTRTVHGKSLMFMAKTDSRWFLMCLFLACAVHAWSPIQTSEHEALFRSMLYYICSALVYTRLNTVRHEWITHRLLTDRWNNILVFHLQGVAFIVLVLTFTAYPATHLLG